jgi:hypothetical protein
MRASPTISWISGGVVTDGIAAGTITSLLGVSTAGVNYVNLEFYTTMGGANGRGVSVYDANLQSTAEL